MPLLIAADLLSNPVFRSASWVPTALKYISVVLMIAFVKWYTNGTTNRSERVMHSRVVMITGGTSGIGARVVYDLASRGAQVVLLTRQHPSDLFLSDYVSDLRRKTNNELIFVEQVDLSSLHSIRLFATKWIDNAPPRRLDMIILCAAVLLPAHLPRQITVDGVEAHWGINYLANFHLLSILSPAIRAQPGDRDVRVIVTTCHSYLTGAALSLDDPEYVKRAYPVRQPSSVFGASKIAQTIFARSFQKHLESYKRPDGHPSRARVLIVDPGFSRTAGMRRFTTMGSLWGLLLYLITWPLAWVLVKDAGRGAQTILYGAMEAKFAAGQGDPVTLRECQEVASPIATEDEKFEKKLWELSEKRIEALEKEGAKERAKTKKPSSEKKAGRASPLGVSTEKVTEIS